MTLQPKNRNARPFLRFSIEKFYHKFHVVGWVSFQKLPTYYFFVTKHTFRVGWLSKERMF
nr:MAG TPA_asm: hypothetical protein [Caudoviricetes sp.]